MGNGENISIRVLLVDDDQKLYQLLDEYFANNSVVLRHAPDGLSALPTLRDETFDAVLLDIMMPGMDGLEVLRRIREKSRLPVIMLTAKGDETDRVVGLELGADDYLAKPFSPRELLARLRAVLRRAQPGLQQEKLSVGGVDIDLGARRVQLDGHSVELTGLEFDLLAALARRAGRVVPRNQLLAEAGRDGISVGERAIDVHISHLRRKLRDDQRQAKLIQTVRGVGYVFARDEA